MRIRIGSYQGPVIEGDTRQNLEVVLRYLREAAVAGLHFVCFPECFLTGYTPESIQAHALGVHSDEVQTLIGATRQTETVVLVGTAERTDRGIYNSQLVIQNGRLIGVAHKTMLTRGYDDNYFITDLDLPVFNSHGVTFGVAICHSTSFVEPALALRWKGARLLFTPHFNDMPPFSPASDPDVPASTMWTHRQMVLNNQAALATLLKMVVVRSNIVKINPDRLGSGDSNIWGMDGQLLAAGTPFTEELVTAEVEQAQLTREHWIDRREVPPELLRIIADAAESYPRGDA